MNKNTSPLGVDRNYLLEQRKKIAKDLRRGIPDKAPEKIESSSNTVITNTVVRQNKITQYVGLGVITVLALTGAGFVGRKGYEKITAKPPHKSIPVLGAKVCDTFVNSVSATPNKPVSVSAPSLIQMNKADGTSVVSGALHYELSTATKVASAARSCGLIISTSVVVNPEYSQSANYATDPQGSLLTAHQIFGVFNTISKLDPATQKLYYDNCMLDLASMEKTVETNAQYFQNGQFPESVLAATSIGHQRVDFAPFTQTPLPTDNFLEIYFTDAKDNALTCTQPTKP